MKKSLLLLAFSVATIAYSQTPITDANFREAINTCLSTNPVDGMCSSSEYGVMPDWDVSNVTDMSTALGNRPTFNADLSAWDVSNVTDMRSIFWSSKAFDADLSSWDVGNVINMKEMFYGSYAFNADLSAWDVGNVTDMSLMFHGAIVFNADLSAWDVGNVTNMGAMFRSAFVFNSDLSGWDVVNVTNMVNMFGYAFVFNSDLSAWDVSNVTNMFNMFGDAFVFNSDLSAWDVSNVTNMGYMFGDAKVFNSDLSAWDVSNVTYMGAMFLGAIVFDANLSDWDVGNMIYMGGMFNNSGLSTDNYDALLIGWSQQDLQSNVLLGADGINYCTGEAARQSLIDNHGWTIDDAGSDCTTVSVDDENELDISVYPNPATTTLYIEESNDELDVKVFDILGAELLSQKINKQIDITRLERGTYIVTFSDGFKSSSHKIIKI